MPPSVPCSASVPSCRWRCWAWIPTAVLKIVEKTRDGARVHKRYDRAQTPYQRLLASGPLNSKQAERPRAHYAGLHPVHLKLTLEGRGSASPATPPWCGA